MTRPTKAFIWRQSIYENDYKCKCGYRLFNEFKGDLSRDVLIDTASDEKWLYCPKCGLCVGRMVDMGETDMQSGRYGYWPWFERKGKAS